MAGDAECSVEREIKFGHLGNGITVFDIKNKQYNDYQKVAHISYDRTIKYFVVLSQKHKDLIEKYARTASPKISTTQNQNVLSASSLSGRIEELKIIAKNNSISLDALLDNLYNVAVSSNDKKALDMIINIRREIHENKESGPDGK